MSSKSKSAKILAVIIIVAVVSGLLAASYYSAIQPHNTLPSTTPSPSAPAQSSTPPFEPTSTPTSSPANVPPIALDGSGSISGEGTVTVSLTTTHENDILYLSVATNYNGQAPTITSTPILMWTQRAVATYVQGVRLYTFYAITTASGAFSITLATEESNLAVVVFGVSGSNTANPFDTASASTSNGVSNSASVSISTTNENDFVIGALAVSAGSSLTVTKDSSFALILTQAFGTGTNGARQTSDEYKIVSETGTYTPTYALSDYFSWVMIADAIKEAP